MRDRARWSVKTAWSTNLSGQAPPSQVEFMQGIESVYAYVCWVTSTVVRYDLTAEFLNGAARTPQPSQNLSSGILGGSVSNLSLEGIPGLGTYFILSGLNPGDSFAFWWRGEPRNSTVERLESKRFAGALRQVCVASYTDASGNVTEILTGMWDRSTGILCQATLTWSNQNQSTKTTIKILETNRWGIVKASNWTTVLVVIVIVAIPATYILRRLLHLRASDMIE